MGSQESKPSKNSGIQLVDLSKCGLHVANDNDISEQDYRDTGKQLLSAFSSLGVARLSNHGIPWNEVDRLNNIADDVRKLPKEDKKRLEKEGKSFGVVIYGDLKTDSCGTTNTELFKREVQKRLNEAYCDFELKAARLLSRLLKALGFGLELKDEEFFVKVHSLKKKTENSTSLAAVLYFPNPSDHNRSERETMLRSHTDAASLVLIFQDGVGGLQVKNESGKFIEVEPIPDTIIVNVGSVLQAWTKERVKAVVHRVCTPKDPNKRNQIRRSLVYIGQANSDERMVNLEFKNGKDNSDENAEVPVTVKNFLASGNRRR